MGISLLVASEFPPNASGGGPAVVRQMLSPWPVEKLYWWSCLPDRGRRFNQSVADARGAYIPAKLMPQRRITELRSVIIDYCWRPFAAAHLRKTIRVLKPDAIWAIPHNWAILPLAQVLPTAGVGFHVTVQDYVDVHGQAKRFGASRCARMARMADELYAGATTRDATSHPMVDDLQKRTGAPAAQVLHAGLEQKDFEYLAGKQSSNEGAIRIAYAGSILVPDEFAFFVTSLRQLRPTLPRPIQLDLYGAHSYANERWFDPSWMKEHGNLPEPELLAGLRECTWGFAPMALTDVDPRYNRFSFPTKFITYLAAGLPVIALGHPESSVMKMASSYSLGVSFSGSDPAKLAEELLPQLMLPDAWPSYREGVISCARREFDAERMRQVLYGCFATCASRG